MVDSHGKIADSHDTSVKLNYTYHVSVKPVYTNSKFLNCNRSNGLDQKN